MNLQATHTHELQLVDLELTEYDMVLQAMHTHELQLRDGTRL